MRDARKVVRGLIFASTAILSACGGYRSTPTAIQVTDIKVYMDRFASTYNIDISYIPANFEKQDGNAVGMCLEWSNGTREIHIDPDYWNKVGEYGREELVFHELGHCALGLEHDNTLLDSGIPTSIMYPYAFGEADYYPPNRPYYFYQLHH